MNIDKFLTGALLYIVFVMLGAITFIVGAGVWFLIAAVI